MKEEIPAFLAVLLVDLARQWEDGISLPLDAFLDLPAREWDYEFERSQVVGALKVLQDCGLVHMSTSEVAGDFIAIKPDAFEKFVARVEREREAYQEIVNSDEDINFAINRAERRNYPNLENYNKHRLLRDYASFGRNWITVGLKRLREFEPSEENPEGDVSGGISVDSTSWTGLPSNFELSEEKRTRLIALLESAERDLDELEISNAEKSMARAFIIAAHALAEAPNPPTDIIWELINRANSIAGVASLFVSIISLFVAAA